MARTKEERETRRLEAKERAEKRKAAKATTAATCEADSDPSSKNKASAAANFAAELRKNLAASKEQNESLFALSLPSDALSRALSYLPAREWGALSLTCIGFNRALGPCRAAHLESRLSRGFASSAGEGSNGGPVRLLGGLKLCSGTKDAQDLIERSLTSGGNTGRLVSKKSNKKPGDEYASYIRFVEEATIGHSAMQSSRHGLFPPFLQGRFVSCSPEHTLLRLGGGGNTSSGAGGSGLAAWGVGKRGQLGHGKRDDQAKPRMLMGNIGWGIRIVQVSAGGGLVRVAHSLLLTSTGRVLSFGTAQYGQLGHGYGAGKQLSDCMRPKFIDALADERCVCVAAGELHSGAVTADGDVYTWGEGFCGQLGLGDRRPQLTPAQVTLGGLEDECVSNLSCGCRHTLAVTEEGEVFSWGFGRFGVLGRSYVDFTYNNDVGMAVPDEGEQVQGLAAQPPPLAAPLEADNPPPLNEEDQLGVDFDNIMVNLDALNLTLDDPSDQCFPKAIDSLKGFRAVGVSAGHRHSMVLDENGGLYTFGSGLGGALGHGNLSRQEYPVKIMDFENNDVSITQMSAGCDTSMAVSSTGDVYAWGKADDGRIGLGMKKADITLPRKVNVGDDKFKAVDVDCGYVHSLVVGVDGSVYQCGGVGVDGADDGQNMNDLSEGNRPGYPSFMEGYNIWHRVAEPNERVVKEQWKKYGKYELQGRSKMMNSK